MKILLLFLFGALSFHCVLYAQSKTPVIIRDTMKGHQEEKGDEDDQVEQNRLHAWERMHRAAPGVNWHLIETNNRLDNYRRWLSAGAAQRGGGSSYANGAVCGLWSERGSNDLAGRCDVMDYDSVDNSLYVMGDGGALYQGVPDSAAWKPVNDQLQFAYNILKITTNGNRGKRIIAGVGYNIYYSDDDGVTFLPSSGIVTTTTESVFGQLIALNDAAQTMYLTISNDSVFQVDLYISTDHGGTWTDIDSFPGDNYTDVSMWAPYGSKQKAYLLANINYEAVLYTLSGTQVTATNTSEDVPPTEFELSGFASTNSTILYALVGQTELFKSDNLGESWFYIDSTPAYIYFNGFAVSNVDSNIIFVGGVDQYYTYDGGYTWTEVNDWSEYYGDPLDYLHADIRGLGFFKRTGGSNFAVINCDGGCYITNDSLTFVTNIGLYGLDVGQFYGVRSDSYGNLYGGTQDQGIQYSDSAYASLGILSFRQLLSGDYGKLQLTNYQQNMWAEYPGGDMYYFNPGVSYGGEWSCPGTTLPSDGWLQATAPVYPSYKDEIYLAGGNIYGDTGSYLIHLVGSGEGITATQINYDFLYDDGFRNVGISAIATTSLDTQRIYVGREDGAFFYSTDDGNTWTQSNNFTGPKPYYLFGAAILASVTTPNLVWYGGSGYSNPGVYRSTDGGATFVPMANGLPSTLVFGMCANSDESLLFAATEAGPYVYVQADSTWYSLSEGLAPAQEYWDVDYDSTNQTAHFATYGRGIWDFHPSIADVSLQATKSLYCTGMVTFTAMPVNGGKNPVYQWKKNGNNVGENSATYIDSTLNDNDSVWVVMTPEASCAINDTVRSNKNYISCLEGINAPNNIGALNIHPNPSNGIFTIEYELTGASDVELLVYNALGQIVYDEIPAQATGKITEQVHLHSAASGIYMVQLKASEAVISKRIVVE